MGRKALWSLPFFGSVATGKSREILAGAESFRAQRKAVLIGAQRKGPVGIASRGREERDAGYCRMLSAGFATVG